MQPGREGLRDRAARKNGELETWGGETRSAGAGARAAEAGAAASAGEEGRPRNGLGPGGAPNGLGGPAHSRRGAGERAARFAARATRRSRSLCPAGCHGDGGGAQHLRGRVARGRPPARTHAALVGEAESGAGVPGSGASYGCGTERCCCGSAPGRQRASAAGREVEEPRRLLRCLPHEGRGVLDAGRGRPPSRSRPGRGAQLP